MAETQSGGMTAALMVSMTEKEIKAEIRATKREMKQRGVRKVSCFNGGLTPDESRYNTELFRLNSLLLNATR